jgi:hypothetical protein
MRYWAVELSKPGHEGTKRVKKRFEPTQSVTDFTDSEAGTEKLNAIWMQLMAIREGLKNLDNG